MLMNRIDNSLG